jgi:hypothetical protein
MGEDPIGAKASKHHARTDWFPTQERQVSMSGKYTEFEKQANGHLRIMLLPEARAEVEEIASKEMDADSRLAETIEWQLSNGWSLVRPEDIGGLNGGSHPLRRGGLRRSRKCRQSGDRVLVSSV